MYLMAATICVTLLFLNDMPQVIPAISGLAVELLAMTGVPHASASADTLPKVSCTEQTNKESAIE